MYIFLVGILVICLCYFQIFQVGIVCFDIVYQIYCDFVENKGFFVSGVNDILVYDKDGKFVGRLGKVLMVDFSSVSLNGVVMFVLFQYIVSVKYNGGYWSVSFGNGKNIYFFVDCNNYFFIDFYVLCLNKLVIEVIFLVVILEGIKVNVYKYIECYIVFYWVGSGMQYIKDKDGNLVKVVGGYVFKIGGIIGVFLIFDVIIVFNFG